MVGRSGVNEKRDHRNSRVLMGSTFFLKMSENKSSVICKCIAYSLYLSHCKRHFTSYLHALWKPLLGWPYYWPVRKSHDSNWLGNLSGLTWTLRPGWGHMWLCLAPKPLSLPVSNLRYPTSIPYLRWAPLLFVFLPEVLSIAPVKQEAHSCSGMQKASPLSASCECGPEP